MTTTFERQVQMIGTTADWSANDLVLDYGEIGFEVGTGGSLIMKVGDGSTAFTALDGITVLGGGSGLFVPLAGTDVGSPITGDLLFRVAGSDGPARIHHIPDDIGNLDVLAFTMEGPDAGFIWTMQDPSGNDIGFAFTSAGNFVMNSSDPTNTDSWQMGSKNILGRKNTFLVVPVDSSGTVIDDNFAIQTNTGTTFVASKDGYFELPRATTGGDPANSAATKGYVDAIIPPGGGESNTASNVGSGDAEVFKQKTGVDLEFRELVGGTDVTLVENTDTIEINFTGGGGTDYLPLGGTAAGAGPITGDIEVDPGVQLALEGDSSISFGGTMAAPMFGFGYLAGFAAMTLLGPTSGSAQGITLNTWDGSAVRSLSIKPGGNLIAGTSTIDETNGASLTTKAYVESLLTSGVILTAPPSRQSIAEGLQVVGELEALSLKTTLGGLEVAGNVIINTAPTLGFHATTKTYVDSNFLGSTGDQTINGNLGIDVTPESWTSSMHAVDLGDAGAVAAYDSNGSAYVLSNAYWNGAWRSRGTAGTAGFLIVGGGIDGVLIQADTTPGSAGTSLTPDSIASFETGGITLYKDPTLSGATMYVVGANAGIYSYPNGTGSPFRSYHNIFGYNGDSTSRGSISSDNTTTYYGTSSDHRLKTCVVPMTGAAGIIQALRPIDYVWKSEPGKLDRGFLAHEVQAVIPKAVDGEKDAVGEDGAPIYQTIDHSKLVPVLVAALQGALADIEELKEVVAIYAGPPSAA